MRGRERRGRRAWRVGPAGQCRGGRLTCGPVLQEEDARACEERRHVGRPCQRGRGRAASHAGEGGRVADRRASRVSERRARVGLKGRRRWLAGLLARSGPDSWVWLLSFSFSGFQTSLKLLNSNMNLNSTLALKQIKQCTSMSAQTILNLEKNLITCGRKLN